MLDKRVCSRYNDMVYDYTAMSGELDSQAFSPKPALLRRITTISAAPFPGAEGEGNTGLRTEENFANFMDSPDTAEREDLFGLVELAGVVLHKAWILLISLVAGAVLAGVLTTQVLTASYEATSMIYISSKTTSITSLADLQIGSQLAVDFQIVATTRAVLEKVIDDLQLNTTYQKLLDQLEITNPSGSHVLKIKATSTDPVMAANISNAVAETLRERIADVMNTEEPAMLERASVPENPSSPSLKRNVALGGALGMVLAAAAVIVAYLMDDTIKNDQDIRKYLHLNTLAVLPKEQRARKNPEQTEPKP